MTQPATPPPGSTGAVTQPATPPPPSSTGSITQTIANGATVKGVVSWYAVYDGNGDKVEDDPGKVEWRVDGNLVRTEVDVPFGDDSSFWAVHVGCERQPHVRGARCQRLRHRARQEHDHRDRRQHHHPPPPPSSTGSITQTIANGATVKGVVSWYAVYDGNGDKVEDDPGKVEWRVDGNLVRTEVDVPFGDDSSFWAVHVGCERQPHVRGARCQRLRHRARQEHDHRDRRQHHHRRRRRARPGRSPRRSRMVRR